MVRTYTHTLSVDNARKQSTGKYCVFFVSRWKGKQSTICGHVIIPSRSAAEANDHFEVLTNMATKIHLLECDAV